MAKRYGLVIDLERCIGCHTCTIACKFETNRERGSGIRVETVGGPHRDTPSGRYPILSMHFLPIPCMHCTDPPCLAGCPIDAIVKRADGVIRIDAHRCDGCGICVDLCPYGALHYDEQSRRVRKCDLCAHRLDQGMEPFCVLCCETEAMHFGDLNDAGSCVSRMIRERSARVLKPELGTNPSVFYCPTRHGRVQ